MSCFSNSRAHYKRLGQIQMYIYIYIHMCVYIYMYVYVYMYMCMISHPNSLMASPPQGVVVPPGSRGAMAPFRGTLSAGAAVSRGVSRVAYRRQAGFQPLSFIFTVPCAPAIGDWPRRCRDCQASGALRDQLKVARAGRVGGSSRSRLNQPSRVQSRDPPPAGAADGGKRSSRAS